VRRDGATVREQLPGVVEDDDSVAKQNPPLLGVVADDASRVMVGGLSGWTVRVVLAHRRAPGSVSSG
jgi:hypothetical protein